MALRADVDIIINMVLATVRRAMTEELGTMLGHVQVMESPRVAPDGVLPCATASSFLDLGMRDDGEVPRVSQAAIRRARTRRTAVKVAQTANMVLGGLNPFADEFIPYHADPKIGNVVESSAAKAESRKP